MTSLSYRVVNPVLVSAKGVNLPVDVSSSTGATDLSKERGGVAGVCIGA